MYPEAVTRVRGSTNTKSPAPMPSAATSAAFLTSSSSTTSTLSQLRSVSFSLPLTWTEASSTCRVPSNSRPSRVWTMTFSVSVLEAFRPPMGASRRRPFAFTARTIAPSVSTWDASISAPSPLPPRYTCTAPLLVFTGS